MKNSIIILLLFVSQFSFGQMKEGMIQYTINVEAVSSEDKAKQTAAMLRNSMMKIYFTQDQLRLDFKMGEVNDMRMVIDYRANASLSLITNTQGNYAILKKASELEYPEKVNLESSIKFSPSTKKVLGYNCKKAIVTTSGVETIYWYTNEISVDFKEQKFYDEKIPGFPMIFSTTQDGLKMSYQVSNIQEIIENKTDVFSIMPPSGYQVINQ